jgi:N-acetylmuramoyl-L-alanine amidase
MSPPKVLMIRHQPSPHLAHVPKDAIPVEFLVLHYTGCTLEETLRIFSAPDQKVFSHFVLDADGTVYDLGPDGEGFWSGTVSRGAHAGASKHFDGEREWEGFNAFSIGIEIVNLNGNLLPYPKAQMDALVQIARHLVARFPALRDPRRVLGHEHVAGFRGKVDPGLRFDWPAFYRGVYAKPGPFPEREPVLDAALLARFEAAHGKVDPARMKPEDWPALSTRLETFIARKRAGEGS